MAPANGRSDRRRVPSQIFHISRQNNGGKISRAPILVRNGGHGMRERYESETRRAVRVPPARAGLALALLLGLAACESSDRAATVPLPDPIVLPAGAFEQPAVPLTEPARFVAGHDAFRAACGACHHGDDRGAPAITAAGAFAETAILRLNPPDPRYGTGLDHRAASAEARVAISFDVLEGRFPDGEAYELRLPRYEFSDLTAGPLADGTSVSPRAAPPMIGTGLIAAMADAVPRAESGAGAMGAGRFGWKAAATDFAHDGLAEPAESEGSAGDLAYYLDNIGAPARRGLDGPRVRRGGAVFATAGCPACHVPLATARLSEGMPETEFYPYSDFLLHDMGKGLADPGGDARAGDWRTAPLWGLGRVSARRAQPICMTGARAASWRRSSGTAARAARRARKSARLPSKTVPR